MENKKFKTDDYVIDGGGNIQLVIKQYKDDSFKCINIVSKSINIYSNSCHELLNDRQRLKELKKRYCDLLSKERKSKLGKAIREQIVVAKQDVKHLHYQKKIESLNTDIKKREEELDILMRKVNDILNWKKLPEEMPTIEKHYLVRVQYSFPKNYKAVIAELKEGVFYTESDEVIKDAIAYVNLPNCENLNL